MLKCGLLLFIKFVKFHRLLLLRLDKLINFLYDTKKFYIWWIILNLFITPRLSSFFRKLLWNLVFKMLIFDRHMWTLCDFFDSFLILIICYLNYLFKKKLLMIRKWQINLWSLVVCLEGSSEIRKAVFDAWCKGFRQF